MDMQTLALELPQQGRKVQLQELSQKHKLVASLLAQGIGREEIAAAAQFTPEYITWLGGDPLFQTYVREMSKLVDTHLEALYGKSVDVIAEQMMFGDGEGKLKAARLQLEATGRIGKNTRSGDGDDGGVDRLEVLAKRLLALGRQQREGVTVNGEARVIPQGE